MAQEFIVHDNYLKPEPQSSHAHDDETSAISLLMIKNRQLLIKMTIV